MGPQQKPTTYWDYIRVEDLLALQTGLERDESALSNDEVRFITIHQIDELWFKLALRELQAARDLFGLSYVPETSLSAAVTALRRVVVIFELAAHHFALMETMRTQDYLRFRDKLSPASGFQSAQFREVEILLGLDDAQRLPFGNEASYTDALQSKDGAPSPAMERIRARRASGPSLKTTIYAWLERTPIHGSSAAQPEDAAVVARYVGEFLQCQSDVVRDQMRTALASQALTSEDRARLQRRYEAEIANARAFLEADDVPAEERGRQRRVRAAILFIDSNRQLPLLSWPGEIIDALLEVEQAMLIFRQRHARMVERVIGRRLGTGGSDGVDYLDQTALRYRIFPEIWAARTLMLQPELSPPVRNPSFYGLRNP